VVFVAMVECSCIGVHFRCWFSGSHIEYGLRKNADGFRFTTAFNLTTFATVDYLRILTQGPSLDDLDILMDDEQDV